MDGALAIAAAQTVPIACDVRANIRQHLQLVEVAAAEGVTLLVFPELSLTGYELAHGPGLAFELDDVQLRPLIIAAGVHGMMLVVGAPLRLASGLHIGALVIEPAGRVNAYTKHHLGAFRPEDGGDCVVPPPEQAFFAPGTRNPIVPWREHKLALSVCADSLYPSHVQAAAERGATIYASCQFAISAHIPVKMARLKEAARSHGFTVIFANYGGSTGGLMGGGGSCIRSPDGSAVCRLPAEGCGLAIASSTGGRWVGRTVMVEA